MLCKVNDLFKVRRSKHLNVKTKWARIGDDNFDRLRMSDKGNERESGLCQYERKWEDTAVLWVCVNRKQLHCKEISNHQQINNTAEHYSGKMNVVRSIRNRRQHVKTGLNVTEWDVTDCSAAIVALVTAQWHVSLQYVRSTVFFYKLSWNMLPCYQCCCHWQYNHASAVNKRTWSDDQSWSAAILNFISIFYGRAEQLIDNLTLVSKMNMTEVFLYLGSSDQNHFWQVKS